MLKLFTLTGVVLGAWTAGFLGCSADPMGASAPANTFSVFDNLHYAGKPDNVLSGMMSCNIIYGGNILHGKDTATLPDEEAFKRLVRLKAAKQGPIVLDIEGLRLSGKREDVEPRFKLFLTLIQWAHEAAPGRIVGYYGWGLFPGGKPGKEYQAEAQQLANAVDAFFPSKYTRSDDREKWASNGAKIVSEAHALAPQKPVYFYLWPQYHDGTPKQYQFLSGDYMSFELDASRKCGANGVVLWSGKGPAWDPNAEWFQALSKFVVGLSPH